MYNILYCKTITLGLKNHSGKELKIRRKIHSSFSPLPIRCFSEFEILIKKEETTVFSNRDY